MVGPGSRDVEESEDINRAAETPTRRTPYDDNVRIIFRVFCWLPLPPPGRVKRDFFSHITLLDTSIDRS